MLPLLLGTTQRNFPCTDSIVSEEDEVEGEEEKEEEEEVKGEREDVEEREDGE